MSLIIGFLFIILFLIYGRYITFFIFNIQHFIVYGFRDIRNYFKHKKYNTFNRIGRIVMYTGSGSQVFGSGKTLSMIKYATSVYKRYNGKVVYNEDDEEYQVQHIHIISNVELYGIPYIPFTGVNQFIDIDKYEFGPSDVTIFVLDESGALFNSREFRDNISPEFLTKLVQSRKNKCLMLMTSQRLQFTDKVLRQICSSVVACRKYWRIIVNENYNALDLEYALNPEYVKSTSLDLWFAEDKHFKLYNTYQLVDKIRKNYKPGMFLNTKEILETYGESSESLPTGSTKRKYRK